MSDHLPADVVTRILVRLPVAALLRCRSVSRSWRALIDSPTFIKLQIEHSAATGENAILYISESRGDYVVAEYLNGLRRGIARTPPAQTGGTEPRQVVALLGSCNGLLCFACDWEKVIVSNPATRTDCLLPFTLLFKSHTVGTYRYYDGSRNVIYNHGYGFGHDPISDDYKVVQIVQLFKPEVHSLNSHLVSYGVRSNSQVDVEFPYVLFDSRDIGVFVGGAMHWIVGKLEDPNSEDFDPDPDIVLVGFDLGRNESRELPQPKYTNGGESFTFKLGELGKCLCIFADYKDRYVEAWMMKEYGVKESWSILFSVPYPGLCFSDTINPLGFSVTGQEVLLQLDGKRLVWYDMKDPMKVVAAEEITVNGLKGESLDAVVCYGSLVSPGAKIPQPKEEVRVDKQQEKPGPRRKKKTQRNKRDEFLASGFKLKL
ncbi:unnamed protein product [Linum tenue]|uniref:F-box domain-containing protein n=1 Tax=Linum tenue TaxID=586396 RepID=A0AAV0GPC6_9ROSI|nr:unnamed protein product [Linum tenue]